MYERFTSDARQVLVVASAASRVLGQAETGTEHLLLALTKVDAWVSDLLVGQGLTQETVSGVLPRKLSPPPEPSGPVPLTPDCRRALETAATLAEADVERRVRPHHLLLGILEVGGGAAGVLIALEVPADRLWRAIVEVASPALAAAGDEPTPEPAIGVMPSIEATDFAPPGADDDLFVPVTSLTGRPALPGAAARCPGCRQPLAAELASSARSVAGRLDLSIVIVSCPSCGWILATAIDN